MPPANDHSWDRSTSWVGAASVITGVLDALSTVLCLQIGVTTTELGAATLATALFPIVDRLGGIGLTAATVREPDPDRDTLSTIYWLGIGAALVLATTMVLGRSVIAQAFPDPIVATLLSAYAARLLIRHLAIVPEGLMKRELRYRELSIVWMAGSLAEIAVKLGVAYAGVHGHRELAIWCFVLGPIANSCVVTAGILIRHPWLPRLVFLPAVAGRTLRWLGAISGGELLYFAYTSADYLVIGVVFGKAAVGVYRLAYELVLDVVRLLSLITAEVAFPSFAKVATDRAELARLLVRFTRQNAIVLAPFLVFVAIEADDLLSAFFGVHDDDAATAARILCCVGAMRALGFILPPLLAATDKASRVLRYHMIAALVLPSAFVAAVSLAPDQSYLGVAWAWAFGYPVAFFALLAMALPIPLATYLRALVRIAGCAAIAAGLGVAARFALVDFGWGRPVGVAVAVVVPYGFFLAWFESVTPRSILRSLRS